MFSDKLKVIKSDIAEAQALSPFRGDVTIVGVTKNQPTEAANEIIKNGITVIAENRVQAMKEKYDCLLPSKKHLIGHLQTNKVKAALELFDLIQSVDSERLLLDIDKEAKKKGITAEIFFQVNIAREEIKFGMFKEDLPKMLQTASGMENIKVSGLMAIMPIDTKDDYYKNMYDLFAESQNKNGGNIDLKFLSMGMSGDFRTAVKYGSNMVRLGRCLFD